jgi:dTDP-4-dehydrorhamnose 3,5-epimerase-like enzyme
MFTDIEEVLGAFIINPKRYHDNRGYFQEHFNSVTYKDKVKSC